MADPVEMTWTAAERGHPVAATRGKDADFGVALSV